MPRNPFLATAIKTDGLTVVMASEIVINTETEKKTNNGALLLNEKRLNQFSFQEIEVVRLKT